MPGRQRGGVFDLVEREAGTDSRDAGYLGQAIERQRLIFDEILNDDTRRQQGEVESPTISASSSLLIATVPLTGLAYALEGSPAWSPVNAHLLALLVFIGPVATSACFVISAEHGRRITAFAMSNFTLGVPLIGIAASAILLGNHLSAPFLTGLALVGGGMVLAAATARRARGR
jgi:drug/metabolite transporter (DMT)-like permease